MYIKCKKSRHIYSYLNDLYKCKNNNVHNIPKLGIKAIEKEIRYSI